MKYGKLFLTAFFAMFMVAGALVTSAEAQTGRVIVRRTTPRPVVVRRVYVDPYWAARYYGVSPYWGYASRYYYDPFYADLYKTPYEHYLEQRWYAQRELAGNQRELQKHRRKYAADGVITAKERRELEDDVRDVQKAQQRLRKLDGRW